MIKKHNNVKHVRKLTSDVDNLRISRRIIETNMLLNVASRPKESFKVIAIKFIHY